MSIQERKKNPSAFLRNIFQILQNSQLNEIVQWAPAGNGFVIKNLPHFQANILPQYFKHKKYSSFVRQLNMYGFHKQRNSSFQNCFLHEQFRRGDDLPIDIKRKPEKKKKAGQQSFSNLSNQANWFSFSQQLKQFFPHIAENILIRSEGQKNKNIVLTDRKNSVDQYQIQSQHIDEQEDEQEEYVSKISLKGLIEQVDQNPQSIKQQQICSSEKSFQSAKQYSNSCSQEINESMKEEFNSYINESYEKKLPSLLIIKPQYLNTTNLSQQNGQIKQNCIKTSQNHPFSMSFLQGTFDSLSGLSDVLIRQNEILVKTHPLIRNMILKSQQNKINYLNQQIQLIDQQEQTENNCKKQEKINQILQVQKQGIIKLTDMLQQHIQCLTEFIGSQEDNPISTTSIRFRLEKIQ